MFGVDDAVLLTLLSTAMAGGSMLTKNPTAKSALGIGSGLAGLGGAFMAPAAAGAANTGTAAAKATEAAAAIPAGTASMGLSDVLKSGAIPFGGAKVPMSALLGVGSALLPEGTPKKILGGTGLGLGLLGGGMNLYDKFGASETPTVAQSASAGPASEAAQRLALLERLRRMGYGG